MSEKTEQSKHTMEVLQNKVDRHKIINNIHTTLIIIMTLCYTIYNIIILNLFIVLYTI